MGSIDHLLLAGESVQREAAHVNAILPDGSRRPGTLYFTERRMIFRSKALFREAVWDVPYGRISDVSSRSNGIGPASVVVTTTSGDRATFKVRYNGAAAIVSTIRMFEQPPAPQQPVRPAEPSRPQDGRW